MGFRCAIKLGCVIIHWFRFALALGCVILLGVRCAIKRNPTVVPTDPTFGRFDLAQPLPGKYLGEHAVGGNGARDEPGDLMGRIGDPKYTRNTC